MRAYYDIVRRWVASYGGGRLLADVFRRVDAHAAVVCLPAHPTWWRVGWRWGMGAGPLHVIAPD